MSDELKKAIEIAKHPLQSYICINTWEKNQKDALDLALKEIEEKDKRIKELENEVERWVIFWNSVTPNEQLSSLEIACKRIAKLESKLTAIKEALMMDEDINHAVGYEDSEIVGYVGGAREQRNRIQKILEAKDEYIRS